MWLHQARPGNLKHPYVAGLFSTKDPEQRYIDLREIGHGSFGSVFFAVDKETNENVAIKKMSYSGKNSSDKWRDILKEVDFLKTFSHPHIIGYQSCYLKDTTCWLVMEYCIGSAADILDVHKSPLLESEIIAICSQTLKGLAFIHSIERIHRDIKAGNILLTDTGIVKLADMGSVSTSCPARTFTGTPFWMAPEVIVTMDVGPYAQSADIWSFGITCIELAERKPPLFNMNCMAALYHIVQHDPPSLQLNRPNGDPTSWSQEFHSFVEQCLKKEPEKRPSAEACLDHPLMHNADSTGVIRNLLTRTKQAVVELENYQFGKLRKILFLDEKNSNSCLNGSMMSLNSTLNDENTSLMSDAVQGETCSLMSQGSGLSNRVTSQPARPPLSSAVFGARVASGSDLPAQEHQTTVTVPDTDVQQPSSSNATWSDNAQQEFLPLVPKEVSKEEAINTLRRTKFQTLRTTKLVSREVDEYRSKNNAHEQLSGYKQMRQTQIKEVQELDSKLDIETDQFNHRLEKEYTQATSTCEKELNKLRAVHNSELEKKAKQHDQEFQKAVKSQKNTNDTEFKQFANAQRKEYKHNKTREKATLRERNLPRVQYETLAKAAKRELIIQRANAEQKFKNDLDSRTSEYLLDLKKKQTAALHELEERLLMNDLATCDQQMNHLHSILRRQHSLTRRQQQNHLDEAEKLKRRHLNILHEFELTNQHDYTRRTHAELKKTHAFQSKQHPREMKNKEAQIRKQYREACKSQSKQYKAYQRHLMRSVPREEQKDLLAKLKKDHIRKVADLAEKYESTLKNMLSEQTTKLETWQEEELNTLSERLDKELTELRDYQSKQMEIFEVQCEHDRKALQETINYRHATLEKNIADDLEKCKADRKEKLRILKERHARELQSLFQQSYQPPGNSGQYLQPTGGSQLAMSPLVGSESSTAVHRDRMDPSSSVWNSEI